MCIEHVTPGITFSVEELRTAVIIGEKLLQGVCVRFVLPLSLLVGDRPARPIVGRASKPVNERAVLCFQASENLPTTCCVSQSCFTRRGCITAQRTKSYSIGSNNALSFNKHQSDQHHAVFAAVCFCRQQTQLEGYSSESYSAKTEYFRREE